LFWTHSRYPLHSSKVSFTDQNKLFYYQGYAKLSEWQVVSRTFRRRFLSWREWCCGTISRRERRSLRCYSGCYRSSSHRLLATNDIVSANIVKPTAIEFMSVDIKLHSEIFTLLDIELLDAIFSEDTEKTFTGILARNFDDIVLRHPIVTSTC